MQHVSKGPQCIELSETVLRNELGCHFVNESRVIRRSSFFLFGYRLVHHE